MSINVAEEQLGFSYKLGILNKRKINYYTYQVNNQTMCSQNSDHTGKFYIDWFSKIEKTWRKVTRKFNKIQGILCLKDNENWKFFCLKVDNVNNVLLHICLYNNIIKYFILNIMSIVFVSLTIFPYQFKTKQNSPTWGPLTWVPCKVIRTLFYILPDKLYKAEVLHLLYNHIHVKHFSGV